MGEGAIKGRCFSTQRRKGAKKSQYPDFPSPRLCDSAFRCFSAWFGSGGDYGIAAILGDGLTEGVEVRGGDQLGARTCMQVDELRAGGSAVETILPDDAALSAFGTNMMDLAARPPAARAGYDQGLEMAGPLTPFWR